ncbi:polysaccharide biosynthesis C-terminal domain-containing protein [Gephyromycinifex aptenodytis]|uniref:polysaccharide biosynthesis C-terminal domain-containing protein n=1 Tax=Gephyromycinifex aptenodytis TaxID=2716227 RepID=UPI00144635B1|nr:NAD-dependent epimerase/dehydratase family protein [Gephyromycinifex aptenodytis]
MKIVLTGAGGFLGWHTRVRLIEESDIEVVPITRQTWSDLPTALAGADVVLHLAGINRGPDCDLAEGNLALARGLVAAMQELPQPPAVVYAGSNYADVDHPGSNTPYGRGKRAAAELLLDFAAGAGTRAVDVRFCGLFGEHGTPDYNSFVATFAHRVAAGQQPPVHGDRELPLLHVQDAAQILLDAVRDSRLHGVVRPAGSPRLISQIARRLQHFHDVYLPSGDIPAFEDSVDVALFNTLRAALWPQTYPLHPRPHSDARGTLVESVRVHGGTGQTFVSTTNPGFVRGNHYHRSKIERFQVVSGTGLIRLRRLLHDDILEFQVSGEKPAVIDMPTLWTHSIENVGTGPLTTLFWSDQLLDPEHPDTYPHPVIPQP